MCSDPFQIMYVNFVVDFVLLACPIELCIILTAGSDGWKVPSIRPLETLHNALTLKQMEHFLSHLTALSPYKTPTGTNTPVKSMDIPVAPVCSNYKGPPAPLAPIRLTLPLARGS